MRRATRGAAWLAAVLLFGSTHHGWASTRDGPGVRADDRGRLLDVPFLPQSEDLCGGAAAAMVLRYWGASNVYPDDFAPLVDRSRAGIAANVLTADIERRGWRALPFQASAGDGIAMVRDHVDAGRPVVALIAVGPDRYHYVVVVAAAGGGIVVHDPARAPYRVLSPQEFDAAWAASGRWALLILPASTSAAAPASGHVRAPVTGDVLPSPVATTMAGTEHAPDIACTSLVNEMVVRAKAGELAGAATGLETATALCPAAASAWRELAGVRFLQARWGEAVTTATRATALAPDDAGGWDLLATSQFLDGRVDDALTSWNRTGRPLVDLVRVHGARRTRHPVVADVVGLPPRSLLTPEAFGLAARRLRALPAAALTQLRYQPTPGGRAELDATVIERPVLPRGLVPVTAVIARMAIHREATLDVSSPTGGGELWSAGWRWWEDRPRVTFAVAVPAVGGLPGVATVEALWERATYGVASGSSTAGVTRQERRRAAFHLTDWATSRWRWRTGVALDRWDDTAFGSVEAGLDMRLADDLLAVSGDLAGWSPPAGGRGFARTSVSLSARTRTPADGRVWQAEAGAFHVTSGAPYDLWSGAGLGRARAPLLRAHPLLDGGVVAGAVFGRALVHGTLEYQHPVSTLAGGAVRVAVFADAARAWHRATAGRAWQTDAGLGLRVALPPGAGSLRLDFARGLRDGQQALSAGWSSSWPGR